MKRATPSFYEKNLEVSSDFKPEKEVLSLDIMF